MIMKVLAAGSGGQGVLTLGNILGNAAMLAGYNSTFLPEYGAAVRGGTANCTVSFSDQDIASPVASSPDILLAMNGPSVTKFMQRIRKDGFLLYNEDLLDEKPESNDINIYSVPAYTMATELGNGKAANMVALGALLKIMGELEIQAVHESLEMLMGAKPKLVELSKKALEAGFQHIK